MTTFVSSRGPPGLARPDRAHALGLTHHDDIPILAALGSSADPSLTGASATTFLDDLRAAFDGGGFLGQAAPAAERRGVVEL